MVLLVFLNKTGNIKVSEIVSELKSLFHTDLGVPAGFGFKTGIIKNAKTAGGGFNVSFGNGREPESLAKRKTQKSARV